jgi:hypothetical protein
MHAEVVTALDAHLAEMQHLRRRLTDARAIEAGERLDVVLQIAVSAQRLAHAVHAHHPGPTAVNPAILTAMLGTTAPTAAERVRLQTTALPGR